MIDNGVKISGYIRPIGESDTFPTHLDIFGKGGIHSTANKDARNLITEQRRSLGMLAYTAADSSMYGLFDGLSNDNWVKLFEYKENRINFNIGCNKDYILVGNKEGVAIPSPILIDMRLDFINFKNRFDTLTSADLIIGHKNKELPKAQALSDLDTGFMFNTGGIISTTNTIPLPNLEYKHLWIGDINNKPQAVTTIDIDNLPSLGTTDVPIPTGGFVGKVWEGTSSGKPEESSIVGEMFADIGILNAKFLAGHFVMNSGLRASFPNAQFLNTLGSGILKTKLGSNGKISIASGGKVPNVNDYVRPIDLTEEIESVEESIGVERGARIGADEVLEGEIVAVQTELEAQIAALAGVVAIGDLITILGFIGVAVGGKSYGDYIRGQSLNVKNTWKSADLNDEGHNAVGDFEFRWPSGYSSDDRGHGTLWFDSAGRKNGHKAEAGLRLFSWDSGGDHIGWDDPIAPLHIGLFGYQNKYHTWPIPNPTAKYKGFIFSIPEFHNENSSDDYYRFPKKFGLYDVTRTISTWTSNKYGWENKETIFEYDYSNFNFEKKVNFKKPIILPSLISLPENPELHELFVLEISM